MRSAEIPPGLVADLRSIGLNPTDLVLYINSGCNLRCRHCYVGTPLLDETVHYSISSIARFVADLPALDRVTVLGGEPLLHPDIQQVIEVFDSHRCEERRITTNLTILKHELIEVLGFSAFRVCVSLDGHTRDSHNAIRGEGSFEQTIPNLRELLRRQCDVEITHTITSENIGQFWEFAQFCKDIGVSRLNLHRVSLRGNAIQNAALDVSASRWRLLTDSIEAQCNKVGSLRIRYEAGFATEAEFKELIDSGAYRHHADASYYSASGGSRVVIFPDERIYISSEAFGTNSHIGDISSGKFIFNAAPENELTASRASTYTTTSINSKIRGDDNYPIPLSVSYRKSAII